jgi:hypothetical protein
VELPSPKTLKDDAVPTIFIDLPNHLVKKAPVKRKPPSQRTFDQNPVAAKRRKIMEAGATNSRSHSSGTDGDAAAAAIFENVGTDNSVFGTAENLYNCTLRQLENRELILPPNWKEFTYDHEKKSAFTICKFFTNGKNEPTHLLQITILLEKTGQNQLKVCGSNLDENHHLSVSLSQATDCHALLALMKEIDESYNVCKGSAKELQVCRYVGCQLLMPAKMRYSRCGPCRKEMKRIDSKKRYKNEQINRAKKKRESARQKMNNLKTSVNN